ncbi:MAG: sulfatase-like hydrolase/transferase [Methylacidiphilales bacterium]|nr:sulfatase-like hydrolase/transferase [Candidatus Methylacidiphilales bacterium]
MKALHQEYGTIGFLIFDSVNNNLRDKELLTSLTSDHTNELSASQIRQDTNSFLRNPRGVSPFAPDIYMILAESHFNLASTFKHTNPIISSFNVLNDKTTFKTTLLVPTVGGGTHTAVFEILSGISAASLKPLSYEDPHGKISALVRQGFPSYLSSFNYQTYAFTFESKEFSSQAQGFYHFGISKIQDGIDLGFPLGWNNVTDDAYLHAVVDRLPQSTYPQFVFISTIENHGPHTCTNFTHPEQLLTQFDSAMPFTLQCSLNEFIVRDTHLAKGLQYLKQRIGMRRRPFILFIFGDHLPFSFTNQTYLPFRSDNSIHQTDALLLSNLPMSFTAPKQPLFLFTIPTLISLFINHQDIFMQHNSSVIKNCKTWPIESCIIYERLVNTSRSQLRLPNQ